MKWLLSIGCRIDNPDLFYTAFLHGSLPNMKWLLDNGCLINDQIHSKASTIYGSFENSIGLLENVWVADSDVYPLRNQTWWMYILSDRSPHCTFYHTLCLELELGAGKTTMGSWLFCVPAQLSKWGHRLVQQHWDHELKQSEAPPMPWWLDYWMFHGWSKNDFETAETILSDDWILRERSSTLSETSPESILPSSCLRLFRTQADEIVLKEYSSNHRLNRFKKKPKLNDKKDKQE